MFGIGDILMLVGFIGGAFARGGARKGLFRTMLKQGMVKGVGRTEAKLALGEGGGALFKELWKSNKGQVAKFARGVSKGGDKYIAGRIQRSAAWKGRSDISSVPGMAGTSIGRGMQEVHNAWDMSAAGQSLALGVGKYNMLGGIGGIGIGVGMLSVGGSMGTGAGQLSSEVPLPSQEIQNANMFIMPRQAYTQRQRALQAISMTQLSLRSAFGQEAAAQHR